MPLRSWVRDNPREPRTPGVLLGGFALVFSSIYFLNTYVGGIWLVSAAMLTLNAYVWTVVIWKRYVTPVDSLNTLQAVAVGLRIALGAHLTSGVALQFGWTASSLVSGPYRLGAWVASIETGVIQQLQDLLTGLVFMAIFSVIGTFGIPIIACVVVSIAVVRYGGLQAADDSLAFG